MSDNVTRKEFHHALKDVNQFFPKRNELDDVIKFSEQELTDEQKKQARENISSFGFTELNDNNREGWHNSADEKYTTALELTKDDFPLYCRLDAAYGFAPIDQHTLYTYNGRKRTFVMNYSNMYFESKGKWEYNSDLNFLVTITETTTDGVTSYTADKTFDEIKAAYESGANVYAMYHNTIIPTVYYLNDSGHSPDNSFIKFLGNFSVSRVISIEIDVNENIEIRQGGTTPLYKWSELPDVMYHMDVEYPTNVICVSDSEAPDGGGMLFYSSGANNVTINYRMITQSGNYYSVSYTRRYQGTPAYLYKIASALPAVTTSDNNQILKVVDGEWEAVDMPTNINGYELVFQETVAEDVASYSRDTDKDGNSFSLTDVMLIIFTKPFAESTNSAGRALAFLPNATWGRDTLGYLSSSLKSGENYVGHYDVMYVKVIDGYQIVDKSYESQNSTNVFGVMMPVTKAGASGIQFHTDATKIMEISSPQGNITCVKIVGYTNPLVSAGTIIALYKKKGT